MSCFIVNKENIQTQAEFIGYLLNYPNQAVEVYGLYGAPQSIHDAFSDCMTRFRYDVHKIYRKLYIMNLKAFNGRYREKVLTFDRYKSTLPEKNMLKIYKHMQCYLYQCAEDATYQSELYKALEELEGQLASVIINRTEAYKNLPWE